MKALILGATGATGKNLLELLLQDTTISKVEIFVRRKTNVTHLKLREHLVNFDEPETWQHLVLGEVLFSCMGTTLKAAGNKEVQWKIDYEYQYKFAETAKQNNVSTYVLVSAIGANSKSTIFYSKMKGQLEDAVKKLNFSKLIIFQPPLLLRKNSDRKGEIIGAKIIFFLNKLGLLKSQKPITTKTLAQAMINAAKNSRSGNHTISGQNIGV